MQIFYMITKTFSKRDDQKTACKIYDDKLFLSLIRKWKNVIIRRLKFLKEYRKHLKPETIYEIWNVIEKKKYKLSICYIYNLSFNAFLFKYLNWLLGNKFTVYTIFGKSLRSSFLVFLAKRQFVLLNSSSKFKDYNSLT